MYEGSDGIYLCHTQQRYERDRDIYFQRERQVRWLMESNIFQLGQLFNSLVDSGTKVNTSTHTKKLLKSNGLLCSIIRPAYPITSSNKPLDIPIMNPQVRYQSPRPI